MTIKKKKKYIEIDVRLCNTDLGIKKWTFNSADIFRIEGIMFEVTVEDYENSSS